MSPSTAFIAAPVILPVLEPWAIALVTRAAVTIPSHQCLYLKDLITRVRLELLLF
jgi:hypothetical protein